MKLVMGEYLVPDECEICGAEINDRDTDYPGPGRFARFCSVRCRVRAHRARHKAAEQA